MKNENESAFVFWGNRLFDWMILNFLWILTSLLSFGLGTGAATMALFYSIRYGMKKEKRSLIKIYLKGLKAFWKQGTLFWGIQLLVFFVLFLTTNYGLIFFGNLTNWVIPLYGVLALETILLGIYFYPLFVRQKTTLKIVLMQSFRLAHLNLLPTLLLLASVGLGAFLVLRIHLSLLYVLPSILAWWIDYWVNERLAPKYERHS